jgi:hypothetical protein
MAVAYVIVETCIVKYKHVLLNMQFWHTLKMADFKKDSVCIKFFFKLAKNTRKTLEILKVAIGEQMMRT